MAVNDVYRLSVDYTLATQVTSPVSGKTAFVPTVQFYSGGTAFDVAITSPLGTKAIAASVAVNPATSSVWAVSQSGTWNITNISGTVSLPTGASTEATLSAVSGKLPATLGRKTAALSLATVQAGAPYETVAASQTDQVLGTTGAAGDYLSHIVIQPVTTGAGAVTVKDGASTIYLFTSGTLADLSPITVPFGIVSSGALSVTTGANVTVLAVGNFT